MGNNERFVGEALLNFFGEFGRMPSSGPLIVEKKGERAMKRFAIYSINSNGNLLLRERHSSLVDVRTAILTRSRGFCRSETNVVRLQGDFELPQQLTLSDFQDLIARGVFRELSENEIFSL